MPARESRKDAEPDPGELPQTLRGWPERNLRPAHAGSPRTSVELKLSQVLLPANRVGTRFHLILMQHEISQHQGIHIRGPEAPIGILWCTDDRLATNVEARV